MSAPPSRRHLLQLAGAAAGTLWLPRSAWSQLRAEADPFRLGVASGSPEADSVVLWTRLLLNGTARRPLPEAGAVTVQWEVIGKATAEEMDTFIKGRTGMTQGWTGSFDKLETYLTK